MLHFSNFWLHEYTLQSECNMLMSHNNNKYWWLERRTYMAILEGSDVMHLHLWLVKLDKVQQQSKPNTLLAVADSYTLSFLQMFGI